MLKDFYFPFLLQQQMYHFNTHSITDRNHRLGAFGDAKVNLIAQASRARNDIRPSTVAIEREFSTIKINPEQQR